MLLLQRSRRRSSYGAYLCAVISTVLLLLLVSVSLLHSRLSLSNSNNSHSLRSSSDLSTTSDELDDILDLDQQQQEPPLHSNPTSSSFFFDPISASIRTSFKPQTKTPSHSLSLSLTAPDEDLSKLAFTSDDLPLDADILHKAITVTSIEDALFLKSSPLREPWGDWFDKKGLFLKKDRMFRSSFDAFNPMVNPLLQDPDTTGISSLTRDDKIIQKWWINEFNRVPFPAQKITNSIKTNTVTKGGMERRTLNDRGDEVEFLNHHHHIYADGNTWGYFPGLPLRLSFNDFMDKFFKRGKCVMRVFMVWNSPPWMYTVRHQRGLESLLFHHPNACVVVFSETVELDFFSDSFVKDGYNVAVVMPNLDQLLKDTPAHVFSDVWFEWKKTKFYSTHYSELIRLAALYKYGGIYLDSDVIVLKPIAILNNSVGMEDHAVGSALNGAVMAFERHSVVKKPPWRIATADFEQSTMSFLYCMAALFTIWRFVPADYGRILTICYRPLSAIGNIGFCSWICFPLFIKECLEEFYMTYDDTSLRWNGADLLTRVAQKFMGEENKTIKRLELKVEPSYIFFPISSQNITRYFIASATETEKAQQDVLLEKILRESLTFHFWNSLTSTLIPEPDSLVTKLINHACIRCSELL